MIHDRILITGIPGTGKTSIGNYLSEQFGYSHVDLEDGKSLTPLIQHPTTYLGKLTTQDHIVFTWGFPTSYRRFIHDTFLPFNFRWFWFDGDRRAALTAFNNRGTVEEEHFHAQIARIDIANLPGALAATVYNPFQPNGEFKLYSVIASELGVT